MATTTHKLLHRIHAFGPDAAFLANVILAQHPQPTRKLNSLLWLLDNGHTCRTGQFATDVLVIDGKQESWSVLDVTCGQCPRNWLYTLSDGNRYCGQHASEKRAAGRVR